MQLGEFLSALAGEDEAQDDETKAYPCNREVY